MQTRPTLRSSEWFLAVYFTYVALLAPWFPLRRDLAPLPGLLAVGALLLLNLLAYAEVHSNAEVFSVARDWFPSVVLDRATGLGSAGGYVGNGVGTAHLAGRTLCDLVLEADTELTRLPWVDHRGRKWEPEPLRWTGVALVYSLYRLADRRERTGLARTSAFARMADLIAGR